MTNPLQVSKLRDVHTDKIFETFTLTYSTPFNATLTLMSLVSLTSLALSMEFLNKFSAPLSVMKCTREHKPGVARDPTHRCISSSHCNSLKIGYFSFKSCPKNHQRPFFSAKKSSKFAESFQCPTTRDAKNASILVTK